MASRLRRNSLRRPRAERIDEILSAARTVFCERGYEHSSVAQIAARIGVVEGTIFRYFPTKRDLWVTVLEHWYEQLLIACTQALPGITGTRARIRFLIWRHLDTVRRDRPLCRLMFSEFRSGKDYRGSRLHDMNRQYTQFLVDTLREGAASGELRSDLSPLLLRDIVYGGIEHHTWNYVCGRGPLQAEKLADTITSLIFDGLCTPPAADAIEHQTQRLRELVERFENAAPAAGGYAS